MSCCASTSTASSPTPCALTLAKAAVKAKISNQRTLLMRSLRSRSPDDSADGAEASRGSDEPAARDMADLLTRLDRIVDPAVFFHAGRHGKPSLALDLMEEFRAIIADSVVLILINNGSLTEKDFLVWREACQLTEDGRKRFFHAYEQRKATVVTHPVFGYKMAYGRMVEVQARMLAGPRPRRHPGVHRFHGSQIKIVAGGGLKTLLTLCHTNWRLACRS